MRGRIAAVICIGALGVGAPTAAAAKRGDSAKHYAGVRWDLIPTRATGAEAVLQLDRVLVPDRRRGGFVNQMLWVNTNHPAARNEKTVAYGGRRKPPYIAAGITVSRRARPQAFVAQRNKDGAYFQMTVPGRVRLGQPLGVVILCNGADGCDPKLDKGADDAWEVQFGQLNRIIGVSNAGDGAGSAAFYVGLEASSPDALAGGKVAGLGYRVGSAIGSMGYDSWQTLDDRFGTPYPAARGGGTATWTARNRSFDDEIR